MSNVIKLVNGGTIQVRTGVMAGVGPAGQRGLVGPAGPDGPQGPVGPEGPIGQILQIASRATISSAQTVLQDVDSLVSFATVAYDEMSCFLSTTNFAFTRIGDYLCSIWVAFNLPSNAGDSSRSLWIQSGTNGVIARTSYAALPDETTYVALSFPFRTSAPGEMINVYTRNTDDLPVQIGAGAISFHAIGSGPDGPPGPVGPAGPVGPVGPGGPTGPVGSASGGYAHYSDLL